MCLLGVMTFDLNLINRVTGGGYLVNFFVLQFYYKLPIFRLIFLPF